MGSLVLLLLVAIAFLVMSKTTDSNDRVRRIAEAIAKAEGFYVSGALPQRNNNPGSLRIHGETTTITKFNTPSDGWEALYRQINLILDGKSNYYRPEMSVEEIARVWTGGDKPEAWAGIVSGSLGVSKTTPLISV